MTAPNLDYMPAAQQAPQWDRCESTKVLLQLGDGAATNATVRCMAGGAGHRGQHWGYVPGWNQRWTWGEIPPPPPRPDESTNPMVTFSDGGLPWSMLAGPIIMAAFGIVWGLLALAQRGG